MKKSNHQANIVKIEQVLPHNNADTLELIHIGGYQCVVKKGSFKSGDLAVYIQPDSVVPQTEPFRFIWGQYTQGPNACPHQRTIEHEFLDGQKRQMCLHCNAVLPQEVLECKRRITVRKFRGEWSEGLLLPVVDFPEFYTVIGPDRVKRFQSFTEGEDVSDLLGITHYDPDAGVESTKGNNTGGPRRRYPRTVKGWFFFVLHRLGFKSANRSLAEDVSFDLPVYDVDAYKNYRNAFTPGEPVVVTEKIHGSNARYVFLDGKMYAGSRSLWKAPSSNCVWRKALKQNPWIEEWCRAHEGYALYGEVVPTQKGFNYGCKEGEAKFFVFDIRTPEGWAEKWIATGIPTYIWGSVIAVGTTVPALSFIEFTEGDAKAVVDGPSRIEGAKHIREGVVVTPLKERNVRGLGRLILKIVSNTFLEKDSK